MIIETSLRESAAALEAGTYVATLKSARLHVVKVYQSEAKEQAIELEWTLDGSDRPFVEKFVRFVLHEKSTLTNRLSALIGRDLRKDDKVGWSLAKDATTGERIDDYEKATGIILQSRNDGVTGDLVDITVNGKSVLGKTCFLALKVNESGYNRAGSQAANPVPAAIKAKKAPPPPEEDDEDLPW